LAVYIIFQTVIKYNILHSKAHQNIPEFGILVLKQSGNPAWHTYLSRARPWVMMRAGLGVAAVAWVGQGGPSHMPGKKENFELISGTRH
jgi:hypothetical protein